jgi:hypothetical protein
MVQAVDEIGLSTHGASMVDVYVDELGNINRRPGLVEFVDLGTSAGIDGLYWFEKDSILLAASDGDLYGIDSIIGNTYAIGHGGTQEFVVGTRVTFAESFQAASNYVLAANGNKIKEILPPFALGPYMTDLADADAPTAVTHVAFIDRYTLGNEVGTGLFHHSDLNDFRAWGGNYNECEFLSDNLVALIVVNREIYCLGTRSLEIFYNDGTSPFSRLSQGYIQRGTIAPYSFVYCTSQDSLCWLDENRQVVICQGRSPVPLSLTMTKYIHGFSTVTDAIGDYVEILGRPYYVLRFPTEGKTLAFDFNAKNWYEWGNWNAGTASYDAFRGNCYAYSPAWNLTLVGDRANGKIYKFDSSTYTDNGGILRSSVRTAHYNHDTEVARKYCNALYMRVKRTSVVAVDGTPDLLVRYRDNGKTTWTDYADVTLQQVGGTEFRGKLTRLGSYYSRQWEFVLSDAYPLCLVSVEEDVEIE